MSEVPEARLDAPRPDRLEAGGDGGNLLAIHLMGLLLTMALAFNLIATLIVLPAMLGPPPQRSH